MGLTKASQVFEAAGCERCNHSGYQGRSGIYELIIIDETLRGMIHRNENIQILEQYIRPSTPVWSRWFSTCFKR